MRFLGTGKSCDLGAIYLRLLADGHEVKVIATEPFAVGTLAGLVQRAEDWNSAIEWIRSAGTEGIILFESVADGSGALQDELRADGLQVIGGSAYGDRLENDRAFAQAVLAEHGFSTAPVREFTDGPAADRYIAERPRRYVLKFNGPDFYAGDNYVGQRADGSDVRAVLSAKLLEFRDAPISFVLMDHLEGIEMGVGAYFDGEHFLEPACIDWEHKRFFTGDMGELTGEMGTVATFDRSHKFFAATLHKLEEQLRRGRYLGYINLNTIVNEDGIWPLEFTCRFGYPGFATLDPIQETSWADLFRRMATRSGGSFRARSGFSVALVLTTPPFPYTRHQVPASVNLPIFFADDLDDEDRRNLHYGEVGLHEGALVTTGLYGWTMVVTGVDASVAGAKASAYRRARKVLIPNMRYRLDIGDRLIAGEWERLEKLDLLDPRLQRE